MPVVRELLRAVVNAHSGSFAQELVVRCLIRVLKTSPTAHIVHKDRLIGLLSPYDILKQLGQSFSSPNFQATLGLVTVGLTDGETLLLCVIGNPCALTIERILLTFRGYPEVLGGWDGGHRVLLVSGLRIVHRNDSTREEGVTWSGDEFSGEDQNSTTGKKTNSVTDRPH